MIPIMINVSVVTTCHKNPFENSHKLKVCNRTVKALLRVQHRQSLKKKSDSAKCESPANLFVEKFTPLGNK